jgi:hypothetical protein
MVFSLEDPLVKSRMRLFAGGSLRHSDYCRLYLHRFVLEKRRAMTRQFEQELDGTKPDSACQKRAGLSACCCNVLHATAVGGVGTISKSPINKRIMWCCRGGLNSRPLPYQGSALPLSYGSAGPVLENRQDSKRPRTWRSLPHDPNWRKRTPPTGAQAFLAVPEDRNLGA